MELVFCRTRYFDKNILPHIDKQAWEWSCSSSDVIRKILCAHFNLPLPQISQEKLEKIHNYETKLIDRWYHGCVVIWVDLKLRDMLSKRSQYLAELDTLALDILCSYFGVLPEPVKAPKSPLVYSVMLGPGKGRVMAVRTAERLAEYANHKKSNA